MALESDDDDSNSSGMSSDFDEIFVKWYDVNRFEFHEDDEIINHAVTMAMDHSSDDYTIGDYQRVGSLLGRCMSLKHIVLEVCVGTDVLNALFQAEGPYNFPLRSLELRLVALGPREFETLVPFLKTRTSLNRLRLYRNRFDNQSARLLARVMDQVRIRLLEISHNQVTVEGLSKILSSGNAIHLEKLVFRCQVGQGDVDGISRFLQRESGSALECISIGINDQIFHEEWLESLILTLHRNSTLKTLEIHCDRFALGNGLLRSKPFCERVSDAVNTLICDTASFDSICGSNHVFQSLLLSSSFCFELHRSAKEVMKINARPIALNLRLRCKLRKYYFLGKFDLQPFLSMKPAFIPKALELLTRSEIWVEDRDNPRGNGRYIVSLEGTLNGIYCFVRHWNLPVLFTFSTLQSKIQRLGSELERVKLELSEMTQKYEKLKFDSTFKMRNLESVVARLQRENQMLQSTHDGYQRRKHPRRDAK